MSRDNDPLDTVARRDVLGGTAAGTAALFAGCLSGGNGDGGDSGGGDGEISDQPMDVIVPWSGGDGKLAFKRVKQLWRENNPDVNLNFRTVASLGANNKIVYVNQRMRNRNPPGSFQAWPGANLNRFGGLLRSVTGVWEENGFVDVMNERSGELCKLNGEYRAVPLGSHRMNNLFYNTSVLEEAGVDPSSLTSFDAFVSALDAVDQNTDATPMAASMLAPWTTLQKWVQVFLSLHGSQAYIDFTEGNGDEAKVKEAFDRLKPVLQNYVNEDASSVTFLEASDMLAKGKAAFMHQGNWLYAKFRKNDQFNYQEQWDWHAFPGTGNMYVLHFDAFTFPSNSSTPQKQELWAKHLGRKDVQIQFNNAKGSAPPRTDVDRNQLEPFLQMNAEHLANKPEQPPTLAHGLAVNSEKLANCKSVIGNNFSGPFNSGSAASAMMDAVSG